VERSENNNALLLCVQSLMEGSRHVFANSDFARQAKFLDQVVGADGAID